MNHWKSQKAVVRRCYSIKMVLKILQYSHEKNLCWRLFLLKLQVLRPATFLKRGSNTGVSCGYCECFKNSFFIENLWWLLLTIPPQLGCFLFGFAPPRPFELKLTKNVAQIIIYYHGTKQCLSCLNWFITCFRLQNMFWKNISWFQFWWKIYTKRCLNNNVNLRLINFRTWLGNGRMPCKQKYWIKNMALKIPILISAFVYFANFFSCLYCSCMLL